MGVKVFSSIKLNVIFYALYAKKKFNSLVAYVNSYLNKFISYIVTVANKIILFVEKYKRAIILLLVLCLQCVFIFNYRDVFIDFLADFKVKEYRLQGIIFAIMVSPYAFLIWFWRDQARQQELSYSKSNFIQAEFFKVQEWLVNHDNPSLQVSALYRLRDFLKGNHGVEFMQPALQVIFYEIKNESIKRGDGEFTPLEKEFREILSTEPKIFSELSRLSMFDGMNLSGISLENVRLTGVKFDRCIMKNVNLNKSILTDVIFNDVNFEGSSFSKCRLERVNIKDCNLNNVDFSATIIDSSIQVTNGNIRAERNMIFYGKTRVFGDIYADDIILSSETQINGKVFYTTLEMANGAEVNGSLIRRRKKDKKPGS